MITVISHRGYWKTPEEKNSATAFERSFSMGFGTETDVRDLAGELVISHDMPSGGEMTLREYIALLNRTAKGVCPQAINIKCDGMAQKVAMEMEACQHPWFVFDMSVPDTQQQLKAGNPTYVRLSEYEVLNERLAKHATGVWLDAFDGTWFSADTITGLLKRGLEVCVVSPDLHKRDPRELWDMLAPLSGRDDLMLCTDLPEDATQAMRLPAAA